MDYTEIYHHGVLGQKWGVRRYQNADGSLTSLGKRRISSIVSTKDERSELQKRTADHGINPAANRQYQKRRDKMMEKTKSENPHQDYDRAHDKSKSVKEMSDQELRSRLNRIQMEQQYSKISSEDYSKGKEFVNKVIKTTTTIASLTSAALTIYGNYERFEKILKKK